MGLPTRPHRLFWTSQKRWLRFGSLSGSSEHLKFTTFPTRHNNTSYAFIIDWNKTSFRFANILDCEGIYLTDRDSAISPSNHDISLKYDLYLKYLQWSVGIIVSLSRLFIFQNDTMTLRIFMAFLWIIITFIASMPTCQLPISDTFSLDFFAEL